MARRRRSDRHDDRDTPDIASAAGHQALHRAAVRSTNDKRQFHPQQELAHGLSRLSTKLTLSRPTIQRYKAPVLRPHTVSNRLRRLLARKKITRAIQKPLRPSRRISSQLRRDLSFTIPKSVAICVRRKERREVLFATGRGGSRKINQNKKRNEHSNIRCK